MRLFSGTVTGTACESLVPGLTTVPDREEVAGCDETGERGSSLLSTIVSKWSPEYLWWQRRY